MALTLEVEQRLERAKLIELFNAHQDAWLAAAKRTYKFVQDSFPPASTIRRDDIAKALLPILEVNNVLTKKLAEDKLKQRYWISDFTDLILDRVWSQLP